MKKISIILFTLIIVVLATPVLGVNLLAQTTPVSYAAAQPLTQAEKDQLNTQDRPAEIKDVQALRLDFKQFTQDPANKKVRFQMQLHSNIFSDRIKITWTVNGTSTEADKTQLERVITVESGKTYAINLDVIPTGKGYSEVFGKAEAFGAEANTVATVRKIYASNAKGEILPLTQEYKNKKTMHIIVTILLYLLLAALAVLAVFIGVKMFIKWYDRDEVKAYEAREK